MKRLVVVVLLTLLTSACSGKLITSGNYTLASGETLTGDLTITSGNAVLEQDSHVTGSILMTSGNLEIYGEVDGDITLTSGNVTLGSQAVVHGDISATSGDVRQAEGARVDGQVFTESSGFDFDIVGNIIGQFVVLPIVIVLLLVFFVFRPSQHQRVVLKRSGSSDELAEEGDVKMKSSDNGFMNTQDGRVIGGIVLIGLGVLFLLSQSGLLSLSGNWWAIFIALPAVVMLYNAFTSYQRAGQMTAEVRRNISGGVIVGTVAVIALTGQWGTLWPLFLIVPGVMMLLGFTKQND